MKQVTVQFYIEDHDIGPMLTNGEIAVVIVDTFEEWPMARHVKASVVNHAGPVLVSSG